MRALAVIPARGGSKGIPKKNLVALAGQPLISYTISAAKKCQQITRVVVSSDDAEILQVAERLGAHPIQRPAELASDSAASEPLIEHALLSERGDGREYDFVALLQPTSPLRDSTDLDSAFQILQESRANSLISVRDFGYQPFKAFIVDGAGGLRGLVDDTSPFKRRQDLPTTYLHNGAIYLAHVGMFLESGSLLIHPCRPYVMSADKSRDVDTWDDLKQIEELMRSGSF